MNPFLGVFLQAIGRLAAGSFTYNPLPPPVSFVIEWYDTRGRESDAPEPRAAERNGHLHQLQGDFVKLAIETGRGKFMPTPMWQALSLLVMCFICATVIVLIECPTVSAGEDVIARGDSESVSAEQLLGQELDRLEGTGGERTIRFLWLMGKLIVISVVALGCFWILREFYDDVKVLNALFLVSCGVVILLIGCLVIGPLFILIPRALHHYTFKEVVETYGFVWGLLIVLLGLGAIAGEKVVVQKGYYRGGHFRAVETRDATLQEEKAYYRREREKAKEEGRARRGKRTYFSYIALEILRIIGALILVAAFIFVGTLAVLGWNV